MSDSQLTPGAATGGPPSLQGAAPLARTGTAPRGPQPRPASLGQTPIAEPAHAGGAEGSELQRVAQQLRHAIAAANQRFDIHAFAHAMHLVRRYAEVASRSQAQREPDEAHRSLGLQVSRFIQDAAHWAAALPPPRLADAKNVWEGFGALQRGAFSSADLCAAGGPLEVITRHYLSQADAQAMKAAGCPAAVAALHWLRRCEGQPRRPAIAMPDLVAARRADFLEAMQSPGFTNGLQLKEVDKCFLQMASLMKGTQATADRAKAAAIPAVLHALCGAAAIVQIAQYTDDAKKLADYVDHIAAALVQAVQGGFLDASGALHVALGQLRQAKLPPDGESARSARARLDQLAAWAASQSAAGARVVTVREAARETVPAVAAASTATPAASVEAQEPDDGGRVEGLLWPDDADPPGQTAPEAPHEERDMESVLRRREPNRILDYPTGEPATIPGTKPAPRTAQVVLAEIAALELNRPGGRTRLCTLLAEMQGDAQFMHRAGRLILEARKADGTYEPILEPLAGFWGQPTSNSDEPTWNSADLKSGVTARIRGSARLREPTAQEEAALEKQRREAAATKAAPLCSRGGWLGVAVTGYAALVYAWAEAQIGLLTPRNWTLAVSGGQAHAAPLRTIAGWATPKAMDGLGEAHREKTRLQLQDLLEVAQLCERRAALVGESAYPAIEEAIDERVRLNMLIAGVCILVLSLYLIRHFCSRRSS